MANLVTMEGKCKRKIPNNHLHLAALFSLMDATVHMYHYGDKDLVLGHL
jgi:hypothetical protein